MPPASPCAPAGRRRGTCAPRGAPPAHSPPSPWHCTFYTSDIILQPAFHRAMTLDQTTYTPYTVTEYRPGNEGASSAACSDVGAALRHPAHAGVGVGQGEQAATCEEGSQWRHSPGCSSPEVVPPFSSSFHPPNRSTVPGLLAGSQCWWPYLAFLG